MRNPAPLRPGDLIGVTVPSMGVPDALRARLDVAIAAAEPTWVVRRPGRCPGWTS